MSQPAGTRSKTAPGRIRTVVAAAPGGPLHVARWGTAGPPIVLLHGLGGSHLNWLSVAPALRRSGAVHAVDLPGFGATPLAGREPTLSTYTAVVDDYLSQLPGKAVLVGNSMGGLLSLMVASRRPDLVRGLVLVDPAVPRGLTDHVEPAIACLYSAYLWPGLGELARSGRRLVLGPEGSARDSLGLSCLHPERIAPAVAEANIAMAMRRSADRATEAVYLKALRSIWRTLVNPGGFDRMASSVNAPVLFIQGRHDRLVPTEAVLRLARLRPEWELRIIEDAGHCPQLEAPDEVLGHIIPWLAALPAPRASRISA